jgi:cytochrome c-type biogenesis protein CcmH
MEEKNKTFGEKIKRGDTFFIMKKSIFILLCLFYIPAFSARDLYSFEIKSDASRFYSLTSELRCLVCQNQTIAESNADLASDLRDQIYRQIQEGKSNQEIIDYLVDRYGDFILYRPPLNKATLLLWIGPILLLLASGSYLFYYLHQKRKEGM